MRRFWIHNPKVGSSILPPATIRIIKKRQANTCRFLMYLSTEIRKVKALTCWCFAIQFVLNSHPYSDNAFLHASEQP